MGKDFFFRADRQRSRVGSGLREGEERQVQCPSRDGTAASPRIGIGKKTGPDRRTISGRQGTRGEGWRSWYHLEPWPMATGTRAEPAAGSHQPCTVGSCWSRKENSPAAQVGGRTILTFCTQQKESGSRLWALLFSKFLLLVPGWNRAQFSLVQEAPRRAASASRSSHHLFSAPAGPARARLAEKDHHLSQVQPQSLCGKDSWRFDLCLCLHIICSDADGTGRVWGGQPRACCLLPEIIRGCYPPLRRTLRIRIPPRRCRCRRRLIFHRRQTGTGTPGKTRASQIFTQTPHACSWRRDRYDQFLEKRLFFHIAESGQLVESTRDHTRIGRPRPVGGTRLAAVAARGCLTSLDPRSRVTRHHHHHHHQSRLQTPERSPVSCACVAHSVSHPSSTEVWNVPPPRATDLEPAQMRQPTRRRTLPERVLFCWAPPRVGKEEIPRKRVQNQISDAASEQARKDITGHQREVEVRSPIPRADLATRPSRPLVVRGGPERASDYSAVLLPESSVEAHGRVAL